MTALLLLFTAGLCGCESRPPLEDLGELEFAVPDLPGMGEPYVMPNWEKVVPRTEEDEMRESILRQNPNLRLPSESEHSSASAAAGEPGPSLPGAPSSAKEPTARSASADSAGPAQ